MQLVVNAACMTCLIWACLLLQLSCKCSRSKPESASSICANPGQYHCSAKKMLSWVSEPHSWRAFSKGEKVSSIDELILAPGWRVRLFVC